MSETAVLHEGEVIVGRVFSDDEALILTDQPALVGVDLERGTTTVRALVNVRPEEQPRGLARLNDDTLWTLLGPRTLGRLDRNGHVVERITRTHSSIVIYGVGSTLVFQPPPVAPDTPVLVQGLPRGEAVVPFGSLRVSQRRSSALDHLVMNMVGCGATRRDEIPCWFVHETNITVMRRDGMHREIPLGRDIPPQDLRPALVEGYPQPIRDVYIDSGGVIWALWTNGTPPEPSANLGWRVSRHDRTGRLLSAAALHEPVRTILRAEGRSGLVLGRSGHILQVALP